MAALLSVKDLVRSYGTGEQMVKALDDVSLDIHAGEFVAIMGASGSGKTTLMNILGCLDTQTSGQYIVNGQDVSSLNKNEKAIIRRNIFGFVFQSYNLLQLASASENVEMPAIYAGFEKEARQEKAKALLEKLGMANRTHHLPSELSGGQQQRVAIARALINEPEVILADEPTGALDSTSGEEVLALLKSLNKEGKTIVLVTHDEEVAKHAQRIIKVKDGKILDDSSTAPKAEDTAPHTAFNPKQIAFSFMAKEMISTAVRSLRANVFRTLLTLLGIIIGVASVIVMLAVGEGSRQRVFERMQNLGTNIIYIRPDYSRVRDGDYALLKKQDVQVVNNVPNIVGATAERKMQKTIRFGNKDYRSTVQGVNASFPNVRDWPIQSGAFFTAEDEASYAPVAVLGQEVVNQLFDELEEPVGQYILIENIPFEVIGTMSEKGESTWGNNQDDVVLLPLNTGLIRLFSGDYLGSISVKVRDVDRIDETKQALLDELLIVNGKDDYSIRSATAFLEAAAENRESLTRLLAAIAAISLLVGGIGVMNIMLVSVTERMREIGIRMASGARPKDIMVQFNVEAVIICTFGGILGMVIGIVSGLIVRSFEVDVIFTLMPIVLSFSCAVGTGIIFGYLPAKRASQVDQVAALSNE